MGGLKNKNVFLILLEARKSKIKVPADSVPNEISLPGFQMATFSLYPHIGEREVIFPGIPRNHYTLSSMALRPLLPLDGPTGESVLIRGLVCPSCFVGWQTKLLSFNSRISFLIPLLHVMEFLVSSRTFFQISALTLGTLSCSACKLCSCPCWHLWTVP